MSSLIFDTPKIVPDRSMLERTEALLGHVIEMPAAALVVGEVIVLMAGVVMRFLFNSPLPWARAVNFSRFVLT